VNEKKACNSQEKNIIDFTPKKTLKSKYKNFEGKDGAYWEVFFVEPSKECEDVLFAGTTMHKEHLVDSLWNKHFGKTVFYNTFICKNSVVHFVYDKKSNTLKEQILCFEDKDFLQKLPKEPRDFYKKSLEQFLELSKEKIISGKSVTLYFDNYKIELSKYKFLVWKNGELFIKNFIKEVEYNLRHQASKRWQIYR